MVTHIQPTPQPFELLGQSEERFRLLIDSVKDYAIFLLDPSGRVVSWNSGAERIKGYSAQEILGRHFSLFYRPEDQRSGKCERELEIALAQGRIEDEGWRVRKDGSQFWANVVITVLHDAAGVHLGFAKVTRDLTERKLAEEQRLKLTQARAAVRVRDELLSVASHELRTPLTALQMDVQALLDQRQTLDPRFHGKLRRLERSAQRLQSLVDALLDVSRISAGQLTLSPSTIDLVALTKETIEHLSDQAHKAGCAVTFDSAELQVAGRWDPLRLEQVLVNLLLNAFKYAAGSAVQVHLRTGEGMALLDVRDHGPGVAAADQQRIFERFERASSPRHYGGLGLGLYISRQIVLAHGGDISVSSEPSGGARFTVRLPTAAPGAR